MIWEDECYLLSKKKFRENANIINIFTQKKGKLEIGNYYGTEASFTVKSGKAKGERRDVPANAKGQTKGHRA